MSDIEEFQGRIVAAMGRIEAGLEGLGPESDGPDPATLQALENERKANAELQDRLQAATVQADADLAALKADLEAQAQAMARLDIDLQRLRRANAALRDSNAALRSANAEGVGEPELINQAMEAELEALRADRASETAEASAILAKLQPLLAAASGGSVADSPMVDIPDSDTLDEEDA